MSAQSDWAKLCRVASAMIRQVNADQEIIDCWTFGGGTAMMLQIDHRISHDVDIFLPDPQALPFLDPQKHAFDFEVRPADYGGDGARSLKLGFEFGEIDFIVAPPLTSSRRHRRQLKGTWCSWTRSPRSLRRKSIHALSAIDKLKPSFVSAVINQLSIKDPYRPIANVALERTKDLLRAV
ncbi:nucleotidyl transferase AbiEii/AbiGii toxin family protein [Bradyrhizobium sp. 18BD]